MRCEKKFQAKFDDCISLQSNSGRYVSYNTLY